MRETHISPVIDGRNGHAEATRNSEAVSLNHSRLHSRQNTKVSDAGPLTQPLKPNREPGIR